MYDEKRYDDYTTGNLLDYLYHQNYYKLTGTGLSRKKNTATSQLNDFTGKLENDNGTEMLFLNEKQ